MNEEKSLEYWMDRANNTINQEIQEDAKENNNSNEVVYISGQNYFAKEYGSKKELLISSGGDTYDYSCYS